jgi:hypothetical protein
MSAGTQLPAFFQSVEAVCSHPLNSDNGLRLASELDGGITTKLDDLPNNTTLTIQGCFVHVVEDIDDEGQVQKYVRVALKCKEGSYHTYSSSVRQFVGRLMLYLAGREWRPIKATVQKIPAKVGHRLGLVYVSGLEKDK